MEYFIINSKVKIFKNKIVKINLKIFQISLTKIKNSIMENIVVIIIVIIMLTIQKQLCQGKKLIQTKIFQVLAKVKLKKI